MTVRIPPPWMIEEIETPVYEEYGIPLEAPPPLPPGVEDATPTEVDYA